MTSKQQHEIDKFFDFISKVMKESGYKDLSYDFIYHHLTRYGIVPGSKNFMINELFDAWEKRFSHKKNIQAYVSPSWTYFCQFVPRDHNKFKEARNVSNHIKLYIPLSPNYIYDGVNILFDFLDANNITHVSKVGSHTRNDSVVIRVLRQEDADKIMEFVKNNKYLQRGLIKTNPFAPNENGVGYACDGQVSFNEAMAALISNYVNYRKNRGEYKYIGANDFNYFVSNIYKNLFGQGKSQFEIFQTSPYFKNGGMFDYIENPQEVYSLKIALGLYMESLKPDFNKEKYYDFYDKTLNQEKFMLENNFDQKSYDKETLELLRNGVKILTEHYDSSDRATKQIVNYYVSGDSAWISTTHNLRGLYVKKHFDRRLREYLKRTNQTLLELIQSFGIYKRSNINRMASHLRFACDTMSDKMGFENGYYNITQYLLTGENDYLTRDHQIRQRIGNSNLRDRVLEYISKNNLTIDEFVASITGAKKQPEDYIEDAIRITRAKYDKLYEQGMIKDDGTNWITNAIIGLVIDGTYDGFTRDNNARKNLYSMVSRQDAIDIVSKSLGITKFELENLKEQELYTMCEKYVKQVTELDYTNQDEDIKIY